jgi:hypothetical protein
LSDLIFQIYSQIEERKSLDVNAMNVSIIQAANNVIASVRYSKAIYLFAKRNKLTVDRIAIFQKDQTAIDSDEKALLLKQ